jgi:methionine-S-sulfoxide reductase
MKIWSHWVSLGVITCSVIVHFSAMSQSKNMKGDKKMLEKAIFAGGCFWCMEPPFESEKGVLAVEPGYIGGHKDNPTYEEVCAGTTGHTEAVEISFDPTLISYEKLLDIFWRNIDPTTKDQQFVDRGTQYRTGIFYLNDAQKMAAEKSLKVLDKSGRYPSKIVTEITKATKFYQAENYHRDYYKKNPGHYKGYRTGSGRDQYLDSIWKK